VSFGTSLQTKDAADYANGLLKALGRPERVHELSDHPAVGWKKSGLFKTTGLMFPAPITAHADGALMALKAIAGDRPGLPKNGSVFLGERARLRRTIRKGRWCAGGYGKLMDTADGRVALNLVRDDDWGLVPAWLEDYIHDWDGITGKVRNLKTDYLVTRAAEIGLAVAREALPKVNASMLHGKHFAHEKIDNAINKHPLIVDLSGLWAGPLASSLLMRLGAKVIKVEGPDRPDGMRLGHAGFYKLLNGGKKCVALNFNNPDDLAALKRLLERADMVIEASRPRAFRQLGINAEDYVARKPGKVWARLTAYGQDENRIGFGDDIAIAAGASAIMDKAHGEPSFVGDALADPVNGLHLALALWAEFEQGGGVVIDMSMRDVLRYAFGELGDVKALAREWTDIAERYSGPLYPLRRTSRRVHEIGEDTDLIRRSLC